MSSNWKEVFAKQASKLVEQNKSAGLIIDLSIPETDQAKSISNFVSEKFSIVCYYSKFSKKIGFIHSASDLQGSILFPESKVVAFDGFRDQAFPILISNESISKVSDSDVPKLEAIAQMDSVADVKGLSLQGLVPEILSCHPFMILPPFLWETAISIADRDPANVFMAFMLKIRNFAQENSNVADFEIGAMQTKCTRLFQFLWLANSDLAQELITCPPSDDQDILTWSKTNHNQYLTQNFNGNQNLSGTAVAQQINNLNQSSTNEMTSSIIKNSFEQISKLVPSDNKKKCFEKLHEGTRNMILNASSSNGEMSAGTPCQDCIDFFKASGSGEASQIFIASLENKWTCNVQVANGVMVRLHNGSFLREFAEKPCNFSPFSFPKKAFRENTEKDALYLQLKELSGYGLSKEDIEQALDQEFTVPAQVDFMKYNVENILGASCFFFSHFSLLSQQLATVRDHIRQYLNIYESSQYYNKYFSAEFLYSLDTRIQVWLKQCQQAVERDMVDDSLIDFSDDLKDILRGKFSMKLPFEIKNKIDGCFKIPDSNISSLAPKAKKRKVSDTGLSSKVDNPSPISEWIVSQDNYDKVFRHNHNAFKSRPKIDQCWMCHRWHSKGYCFNDCNNKETHIPSSELSNDAKSSYKKWFAPLVNKN